MTATHRTHALRRTFLAAAASAALLVLAPASAHHSSAMFDFAPEARVEFRAIVTEFSYTQPHSWLYVEHAETGVAWGFEMASPSLLRGRGISPRTFQPGEEITVIGAPLRDGRPAGSLVCAIKADGTRVNC
jgi:hypothetical protein